MGYLAKAKLIDWLYAELKKAEANLIDSSGAGDLPATEDLFVKGRHAALTETLQKVKDIEF